MYRLLAIAKYDERYVIPPAHAEQAHSLEELATECSVSEYGGGQQRPLRRGLRCADADRGRELPDAAGPADLRLARRARRTRVPGQPAQLGRQGLAARPVPAEGVGLVSARRPKPALPPEQLTIVWQSVSLLLDYPDEDLLAPGRLLRSAVAASCRPRSGTRSGALPGPPRVDAAAGAAGRLRRDLRHPPALQPLPDLLRPRRHPQAGDGAAALQADLPLAPASSSTTPSCPTTSASSSSSPPPSTRRLGRDLMLDHRAGLELLRLSLRDMRLAVGEPDRRRHRHAAAAARRRARRRTPARRRGTARGGGRARAVRRPRSSARARRRRATLLPMPSFPGARA